MTAAAQFYRNSIQAMEQQLYGTLAAIEMAGREYCFRLWQGEQLPDRLLAYDTETELIEGRKIPRLALATVCGNAGSCFIIHADDLPGFIHKHQQAYYCCHNAVFDFWATAQHLQPQASSLAAWWDIAGSGRLCCTMILDQLIRLARIDAIPIRRNLAVVAKEYAGVLVDKDDPFRLRYGELIGVPASQWPDLEPGFWQYAAADPVATLLVMQKQAKVASRLIEPYRSQLLPGAERSYGPLTSCLQVQGAIALDYASRVGISVDRERVEQVQGQIWQLVEQAMADLEAMTPGQLFQKYKRGDRAGQYKLTASGTAKRDTKAIKQQLEQIATQHRIRVPRLKDGSISDARSFWTEYTDIDPFVSCYVQFMEQAKLLQFFAKLQDSQIYPNYQPLVRTGRSSCSKPNLQQLPRDSRFREMITAAPGYWLLQIDYSALELRTLAAICLQRYGRSTLAELFATGVDPHQYTAALLLGLTLDQFQQLPKAEQKQHRQKAKAVNFGVPGGLGAESLVSYALHSYGVVMTFDEAKELRNRLTKQVYPELQRYLQDQPWQAVATNLQCTVDEVRQVFTLPKQLRVAADILAGETAEHTPELIKHCFQMVRQLNRNEQLRTALEAEQPSLELSRRVFWGSTVTPTGRLRGHVGFTQRANSPFQGLAADGNKLALFRLLRAGFQVCGFVHDEMLILIPRGADYDNAVQQVQQILCDAMQELTPGVPISTEFLLADRWYKGIDDQPRDDAGRLVPYCCHDTLDTQEQDEVEQIWAGVLD